MVGKTTCLLTIAASMLAATAAITAADRTATLTVAVVDADGAPVPEVAILVKPVAPADPRREAEAPRATLMQQERAFVPHILIVETGTVVEFPNRDEFLHHVYSFSAAKRFEFPLYGGAISPEIAFDRAGIVTLGCNIHDGMVGYIVVADTPWFALTDADGLVSLSSLPTGEYEVEVWTPRLRPDRLPEPVDVFVHEDRHERVEVAFRSKLRPPHADGKTLIWDRY